MTLILLINIHSRISQGISKKFEMIPMRYSEARGTLIYEKNLKSKISCQTPFNSTEAAFSILPLSFYHYFFLSQDTESCWKHRQKNAKDGCAAKENLNCFYPFHLHHLCHRYSYFVLVQCNRRATRTLTWGVRVAADLYRDPSGPSVFYCFLECCVSLSFTEY